MGRLDLVVGCNGAGKSTFVRLVLAPQLPNSEFVNADVIAAREWPDDPQGHAYEAARNAAQTRERLIAAGRSFIAETVFSHPSKLDLVATAKAAGFDVVLHVLPIPEELAVARVAARVVAGGHDVPEDKIRGRYPRIWPLVAGAIAMVDSATVWDNSRRDGPSILALFVGGLPVGAPQWPEWAPADLIGTTKRAPGRTGDPLA